MNAIVLAVLIGAAPLPPDLRATGFYELQKAPFEPRYPLWSDGASKQRWIHLPAGTSIDKSKADAWEFPAGTRLWKQFGYGKPVETRYIERMADGSWRYATYVWNTEGTRATLAPDDGVDLRTKAAPTGTYVVPSRNDCVTCHEGAAVPVLGYSAVQLSSSLPPALGYLHGNCGHCHNDGALPGLDFTLAHQVSRPQASLDRTARSVIARASLIPERMKSHDPVKRMPPLGVQVHDAGGLALIERWIREYLRQPQENRP
jgi:hypothetical protein